MALPAITVFDLETTGLDPKKGHRIIEIAGVRIENGHITNRTFSCFVNPERPIPAEARQVNGINDQDVASAPTIMTVLPEFLAFAERSILIAHNAAFDMSFLQNEKEFCWGYVDLPECFCSMRLSQSLYPQAFRHSLDILSERFQMPIPEGRHRALPDVLHTAQLFMKMIAAGNIQSLDELRRKASFMETRTPALR